jgi:hypothetical protein
MNGHSDGEGGVSPASTDKCDVIYK